MSRYFVIVEDAETVWPPMSFDDGNLAVLHAIKVAKTWEGVNGAPRLSIRATGVDTDTGRWTVERLLTFAKFIGKY
jgi:hypothetical protein